MILCKQLNSLLRLRPTKTKAIELLCCFNCSDKAGKGLEGIPKKTTYHKTKKTKTTKTQKNMFETKWGFLVLPSFCLKYILCFGVCFLYFVVVFFTVIVRTSIIEEIACADLLFEGYGNLPPGGFQTEDGQVENVVPPGTTLVKTERGQTPSHLN